MHMELFQKARTVRLRSYWDKYLIASDDEESVIQDRDGTTANALWVVEVVRGRIDDDDLLRFVSCYGKYLTASNVPFVPKTITGKMVLQTSPCGRDPRTEWEPIRDGFQVKLRTLWGNYLRPNGGVPPWRNAITHDVPFRNTTQNKILWDVEVVESCAPAGRGHVNRRAHSDYTFDRSRTFSESNSSFLSRTPNVRSTPPSDFV